MLRAVFFDFNGVIVDDEFLHCSLFQKTLAEKGLTLSKEEYYQKYLGYDDHDAFEHILRDRKIIKQPRSGVEGEASRALPVEGATRAPLIDKKVEESFLEQLIQEKAKYYQDQAQTQNLFIQGAVDFIRTLSEKYYLGIVSGALKQEIEAWLLRGKIRELFQVIISAQDVKHGKPDPEGYLKALDAVNRDYVSSSEIILPQECLVIEDSIWGIEAAHEAGMKCLALTTSYKTHELQSADWVAENYSGINLSSILPVFG